MGITGMHRRHPKAGDPAPVCIRFFQDSHLLDRVILDSPDFHGQTVVEKHKKLDTILFGFKRRN
jgi:hypothetical protein